MKKISNKLFILIETVISFVYIIIEGIILKCSGEAFKNQALASVIIINVLFILGTVYECLIYKGKRYIKAIILSIFMIGMLIFSIFYKQQSTESIVYNKSVILGFIAEFEVLACILANGVIYSNERIKVEPEKIIVEKKEDNDGNKVSLEQMWGATPNENEEVDYDRNEYFHNQSVENNEPAPKSNQPTLPLGFVSRKEKINYYLLFTGTSTIFFIFLLVLLIAEPTGYFYYMIGIIVLDVLFTTISRMYRIHTEKKPFKDFEKTLDANKLIEDLDKILEENLHPETRNYILMQKKYYLSYIDTKKAKEIQTEVPKVLNYYVDYVAMKLDYYWLHDMQAKYVEYYNELKGLPIFDHPLFKKMIISQKIKADATFGGVIENNDVEKYFKVDTKNKMLNLINMLTCARYYKAHSDYNKTLEYVDKINQEANELNVFKEEAQKLI